MYKTIKEIKSPMKLTKGIYIKDVLFVVVYFMFTKKIELFCYSKLVIPLYILNLIWGIYLVLPSLKNRQRKNWQILIFTIINMVTDNCFFTEVPGKALTEFKTGIKGREDML